MEVVPVSVGVASRAWDEQHLDLAAASRQIDRAGTGGFTAAVSQTAARFTSAWTRHAEGLGTDCETRADGLRAAIADFVATDELSFHDLIELLELVGYADEVR
jgi:hypothetical protein